MHNYYFKVEVKGRGRFPLDQLRRFEMFPVDIDTPTMIEDSIEGLLRERTYTLGFYASTLSSDKPCADRFASFGFIMETLEVWKNDELFYKDGEVVGQDAEYIA